MEVGTHSLWPCVMSGTPGWKTSKSTPSAGGWIGGVAAAPMAAPSPAPAVVSVSHGSLPAVLTFTVSSTAAGAPTVSDRPASTSSRPPALNGLAVDAEYSGAKSSSANDGILASAAADFPWIRPRQSLSGSAVTMATRSKWFRVGTSASTISNENELAPSMTLAGAFFTTHSSWVQPVAAYAANFPSCLWAVAEFAVLR